MENDKQEKQESLKQCDRGKAARDVAALAENGATVNDIDLIFELAKGHCGIIFV
jgi:hypothetical protein